MFKRASYISLAPSPKRFSNIVIALSYVLINELALEYEAPKTAVTEVVTVEVIVLPMPDKPLPIVVRFLPNDDTLSLIVELADFAFDTVSSMAFVALLLSPTIFASNCNNSSAIMHLCEA